MLASHRRRAYQLLENRYLLEGGRILLAAGKGQDRRKVAAQHDPKFVTIRHEFDSLNKRAQHLCGPSARLLIAEMIEKGGDLVVKVRELIVENIP